MIPQRVAVRGFLSYRDEQVLELDDADLWVFAGRNGSGKSAIFDAITFALFGMHRGGQQNAGALIHHGSDGFRVDFDFELGDRSYRIRRSLKRSGRSERQVFVQTDGEGWSPVPGTSSDAGLKQWVQEQLGLNYATFTSSVLLLQGQADRLLSATPKDRHKVLAGIVDLERFEQLARRADQVRLRRKGEAEAAAHLLRGTPPVGLDDLEAADAGASRAAAARVEAAAEWRRREERLALAGRWSAAVEESETLSRTLRQSLALPEQAEALGRDVRRLRELGQVVPILAGAVEHRATSRQLETLHHRDIAGRDRLARLRNLVASYRDDAESTLEGSALALRRSQEQQSSIAKRLASLAPSTERARSAAEAREEWGRLRIDEGRASEIAEADARALASARALAEIARDRASRTRAALDEADAQLGRLEGLGAAASCDHCGQALTPEHFSRERSRRQAVRTAASDQFALADCDRDRAFAVAGDAESRASASLRRLEGIRARLEALRPLIDHREGQPCLAALVAEAETLQAELLRLESECRRARAHHDLAEPIVRLLQSRQRGCEGALADRERAIQEGAIRLAGLAGQLDQARASLPDPWRCRLDSLSPEEVRALSEEWEALRRRRVEEQAEELPRARERAELARNRLGILEGEIAAIPPEARCEPGSLAGGVAEAERAAALADREERAASVQAESLRRAFEVHRQLRESAIAAEREHQVAEALARLLGRDGLQRTLLRQAEEGILSCANPILRELSGDELQLRAAEPEEGESEPVFALEAVETIGGTTQVQAVEFLSGSQRFRVAVALALGIGRYARGLHRPIESVIIDEGFGSLDRHGRHEMIEQLRSLRGSLARILLVSHQDEFIDAFQDGYRFERIDGRTVVSEFHR